MMMIPVIMAGGSGTRLWPLSRTAFPKQFLALAGQQTMLQQTTERLQGVNAADSIVICNEEHRFLVAEQLRQQNQSAQILLEPVGRNTAPAIALAAFQALANSQESDTAPVLLVLAADHVIKNIEAFQQAVLQLLPIVEQGMFGTFGIVPHEPAIGYGYIERATQSSEPSEVKQFVEKPDLDKAKKYIAEGFLWNSGMFMLRADRYLETLKQYRPDIYSACEFSMQKTQQDMDFIRVDQAAFEACPDESIDYAIMEPLSSTGDVVVASLDVGWSDVGSWSALWDVAEKNEQGNSILCSRGEGANVIMHDTKQSLICSGKRLVTTLGVDNLVIVDTDDALLVANKDQVQNVKKIVEQVKASGRSEHHQHREVYRPWGKYDSIDSGERYQVKRITVDPGQKLSVQMHHHRAEHWVVVSGTAKVKNGDNSYLVSENESTFIPVGQVHALENPGVIPLEMIEVQSGSYLGEDDIVRIKDQYGRV